MLEESTGDVGVVVQFAVARHLGARVGPGQPGPPSPILLIHSHNVIQLVCGASLMFTQELSLQVVPLPRIRARRRYPPAVV